MMVWSHYLAAHNVRGRDVNGVAVGRRSRISDLTHCGNGGGNNHAADSEESEPSKHCVSFHLLNL
jgi:hypothetical protein